MLYHLRKLRRFISPEMEYRVRRTANSVLPSMEPTIEALFHCCAWKTGSQWVRLILSDPRFYMETGLQPVLMLNPLSVEKNPDIFPVKSARIVMNGFIDYKTFLAMPKPAKSKALYIVREPRNLLVSWYLSTRYSHRPNEIIMAYRRDMEGMTEEDGMIYTINMFGQIRDRVKSWVNSSKQNLDVRIVRFEELTGPKKNEVWKTLLSDLGLEVREKTIKKLLKFYSIDRLKPPTRMGMDLRHEKYSGHGKRNWEDYLTPKATEKLFERFPDLFSDFGYMDTKNYGR